MKRYVVTAPYVTVKVRTQQDAVVLGEFYKGAVLPESALREEVERLLGKDMLAEQGEQAWAGPPADGAKPPVEEPDGDPVRPADNANKPAWVDYAVAMRAEGVSEEDARAEAEATKKDDLIARFPAE